MSLVALEPFGNLLVMFNIGDEPEQFVIDYLKCLVCYVLRVMSKLLHVQLLENNSMCMCKRCRHMTTSIVLNYGNGFFKYSY